MKKSFEERFWSKVDKLPGHGPNGDCWVWTATLSDGYGSIWRSVEMVRAHRVVWELTHGPIPEGEGPHGTCVCHRCDNRACVNPQHLFLGTNADNMADRTAKGRGRTSDRKGEANQCAKLTERDVLAIRATFAAGGVSQTELARRYDVTQPTISLVVRGRIWTGVLPANSSDRRTG